MLKKYHDIRVQSFRSQSLILKHWQLRFVFAVKILFVWQIWILWRMRQKMKNSKVTGMEIRRFPVGNMDTFVKLSETLSAHDHNKLASPLWPLHWNPFIILRIPLKVDNYQRAGTLHITDFISSSAGFEVDFKSLVNTSCVCFNYIRQDVGRVFWSGVALLVRTGRHVSCFPFLLW